jgi:hypothetical protein
MGASVEVLPAVQRDSVIDYRPTKESNMRTGLKFITPVLAASAAAVAIAAAPIAVADNPQQCVTKGTATKCQNQGNVEINSSIPAPNPGPWAVYGPFWFPD